MLRTFAILVLAELATGQTAPLAFDVTSVKATKNIVDVLRDIRAGSGRSGGGLPKSYAECGPGGNFTQRVRPPTVTVMVAYGIRNFQISGEPVWAQERAFDIDGRTEAARTAEECRLMTQELLKDRFHLLFHWESKEIPIFALELSKGGAKLR